MRFGNKILARIYQFVSQHLALSKLRYCGGEFVVVVCLEEHFVRDKPQPFGGLRCRHNWQSQRHSFQNFQPSPATFGQWNHCNRCVRTGIGNCMMICVIKARCAALYEHERQLWAGADDQVVFKLDDCCEAAKIPVRAQPTHSPCSGEYRLCLSTSE